MKRKSVLITLPLVLIFVFGTCSRNANSSATKTTTDNEVVTLTYWDMVWGDADGYPAIVNSLIEKYEAENGGKIKIKVQMTPWDNYYQVFLTAITSGMAPDYSTGAFPQAVQYAAMDEILYLDDIVNEWKAENNPILNDMIKNSVNLHMYDGHYVGIPWSADSRQLIYREDAFEQAGITELPKNFTEFLNACRAIRDKTDFIPFVVAPADTGGTHALLNFLVGNGIGIVDNNMKPLLDTPQAIEVLQLFKILYDEQLVPEGVAGYISADLQKLVATGRVAIAFSNPPTYLSETPEIEKQISILPPLAGPSGTNQNFTWMAAIMGYKQTKHPDEVKTTIKWWLENDIDLWTTDNATSPLPIRLSYFSNPNFTSNRFIREIGQISMPSAVSPVWPASSLYPEFAQIEGENYLGIALQKVMQGQDNLEAVAKEANDKIGAVFD
jgi:multiple sugar transport system substrate-binding protein